MSERLGPETKAIIKALNDGFNRLKPAHENLSYMVVTLDLGIARANVLYDLPGWFDHIAVGKITGTASIRLNEPTKDSIDLEYVKTMDTPVHRLYITNDAQANCEVVLAIGGDASFLAEPTRTDRKIFQFRALDEDGALNIFETSQIKTALPVFLLDNYMMPEDLKSGIAMRLKVRLNPTNAVTYRLRIWDAAIDGAVTPYMQETACLYEMDFDAADDIAYTIILNRPFDLDNAGQIFYSIEWSAAPGNTPGVIELYGERVS